MENASTEPMIVTFGLGESSTAVGRKTDLGEKAWAMMELAALGAPIPPGIILTAPLCGIYLSNGNTLPEGFESSLARELERLTGKNGRRFGDEKNPMLVSLRSSPYVPMRYALKTVVNIGINEEIVRGWADGSVEARFAWDAYRRFLRSYGEQVTGLQPEAFDEAAEDLFSRDGVEDDTGLDSEAMEEMAQAFLAVYSRGGAEPPPSDPMTQLVRAIETGFREWDKPATEEYRLSLGLEGLPGNALLIQSMVFGTAPGVSGAGRFLSRHPVTGEKTLNGKYLSAAMGTDLTAGTRMAEPLESLFKEAPQLREQIVDWQGKIERHFHDAREVHFAVEDGRLAFLLTLPAPRSGKAGLKIALDMVDEGLATERQALKHLDPLLLNEFLHPILDPQAAKNPLTRGLPASPGSAVGQVVFFAEQVEDLAAQGVKTILVRHETTPEDIGGLNLAQGILTVTGGLTSHAAVVARGMGKCCIVGVSGIELNYHLQEMTIGETTVRRLDWISLDGSTGQVYLGQLPQIQTGLEGAPARLLEWADRHRTLGVRANADNAKDAAHALELGAEGIGLCRTEHMFFEIDRIPLFRKMILAMDHVGRSAALADLMPLQRKDFMDLFRVMDGRPVTIRLLDPPLHEFLPRGIRSQNRIAKAMGITVDLIQKRIEMLMETNPMLGHRGCRLAITYPEIYQMQVRAIVEAACIVTKEGVAVEPEIMVPLVSTARELDTIRRQIDPLVQQVMAEMDESFPIAVGTMLETPRAAVCARTIARRADFFSFGTNDLTQMSFGFSRDDAGIFLPTYIEQGILDKDPFVELDYAGVGGLMRMAIEMGREGNPDITFGICGEHGGDPASVRFSHRMGLDYVSCSPYRIPIARLAAAQAAVLAEEDPP